MSKQKVKGFGFEREIVNIARGLGHSAERARGSDGRALGLDQEVDVVIDNVPFGCKRRKNVADYIKPHKVFGQIIRGDRDETYVVIRLEDMLERL